MGVVIDSCGWIEFFSNGEKAGKYEKWIEKASPENYFCPAIVVYEVYKHIKKNFGDEAASRYVTQVTGSTTVVMLDEGLALDAADISLSTGLAAVDAIILATARRTASVVVTSDAHFKGLKEAEFI